MGLISYYKGGTDDMFAKENHIEVKIKMSKYQENIYNFYKVSELGLEKKKKTKSNYQQIVKTYFNNIDTNIYAGKSNKGRISNYKTYTRQSSNFVFPFIDKIVNGQNRPRPKQFDLKNKEGSKIERGKSINEDNMKKSILYIKQMHLFIEKLDNFFLKCKNEDINKKKTLEDDINLFIN